MAGHRLRHSACNAFCMITIVSQEKMSHGEQQHQIRWSELFKCSPISRFRNTFKLSYWNTSGRNKCWPLFHLWTLVYILYRKFDRTLKEMSSRFLIIYTTDQFHCSYTKLLGHTVLFWTCNISTANQRNSRWYFLWSGIKVKWMWTRLYKQLSSYQIKMPALQEWSFILKLLKPNILLFIFLLTSKAASIFRLLIVRWQFRNPQCLCAFNTTNMHAYVFCSKRSWYSCSSSSLLYFSISLLASSK